MSRNRWQALRVGSMLVAAGGAAILVSQAVAGLIVVQVLGTVLHHMLG